MKVQLLLCLVSASTLVFAKPIETSESDTGPSSDTGNDSRPEADVVPSQPGEEQPSSPDRDANPKPCDLTPHHSDQDQSPAEGNEGQPPQDHENQHDHQDQDHEHAEDADHGESQGSQEEHPSEDHDPSVPQEPQNSEQEDSAELGEDSSQELGALSGAKIVNINIHVKQ